ncbi:MAG: alanine racemase [Proteobacteria bacterium]|nr:alanine racemase [Pseudomonadota bacterium]MBU1420689.1 alanine racemase [Pseudomonadota bacterium]MBU1454606.1 alanine racemase [Pseudomonadota bacterium]
MSVTSFNQIRVSSAALRHNYRLLQQRAGNGVRVLAMVKADAYGHGMEEAARVFASTGCNDFGVAEIGEAVRLRSSGIIGNIFVFLGFRPEESGLFFEYDITPIIYDLENGAALSREALRRGQEIVVHLKVDCGMGRLGLLPEEVDAFLAALQQFPGIVVGGILSHFPMADEHESQHSVEQFSRFAGVVTKAGKELSLVRHIANSGGVLYFPHTCCDMVRAGISLYGYYPDGRAGREREKGEKLQPAMSFVTRVLQVRTVPAGTGISYGYTYTTERETRLAVLPVGYEDGLSRSLSNRGEVLIRGKRAAIRGRICMNLCIVDISEIEGVQSGDEVVILGHQGDDCISGDEIAERMNSISYEVLCLFGNNNERTYKE